ncbi:carotenoid biosynthesis protein [Gordonia sp. OPL2]|uniref:carotenoid biosynthesis protein n=1 Tax=Gordonia sp. OPL2 TaxID=2486274 RepID=UPI0016558858|nr:carotenoid biosynthesis protein [Gordonia sp. OPL2]ROZ89085.1 carotenoid biosynthesis protein [Gordonia sp. OPL2]
MSPFEIRARPPAQVGSTPEPATANRFLSTAAWILFAGGVVAQIAFPYTNGGNLVLTVASVALLAAAVGVDLASTRGGRAVAALLIVAGGGGLLAESVGVHTGFPFGSYDYTGTLGVELLDVPVVVPFAWIMMAWPALAVARRLTGPGRRWATAVVGACALTAWDVFLDPQMVDQGYWRWHHPDPALPGVDGIPLTNFAGWLLVSFVMIAMLDRLIGHRPVDALPIAVYLWTYVSSVIAHALFFGRPPVALVGGVIMGLVAIPLIIVLVRDRREGRQRALR